MKLELYRDPALSTNRSTGGDLYVDGVAECVTLELPRYFEGKENVHQKCCILAGEYHVGLYFSPHHQRLLPILLNVPNRDDIEIHVANKPEDLLGCIGVGQSRSNPDWIGGSKLAFDALFPEIQSAVNSSGCTITIYNNAIIDKEKQS